MRSRKINHLLKIILIALLLAGCASSGSNKAPDGQKEDTPIMSSVEMSEFILGTGDTVDISVYRHDDLKKTAKIDQSGKIMFPLIGDVQATGKSIFKLRDEMRDKLSKYIVEPQVVISIASVQSQKILVLGEVNNPGVFALDSDISALEAIVKAGGLTDDAKSSNVILIRKDGDKSKMIALNLKEIYSGGNISQNLKMQSADILYVPSVVIADVSWFFGHLSRILGPIVNLESGIVLWPEVKDVILHGESTKGSTFAIPTE